ncbi:helix-turn-helix domain-containing protein [Spirosoma arboris]|uniref:helix-turn-helix domain-containing protein n=1 Tax=Spirosoma arboris TaxID=2682092 RepID=UPI0012F983E9|nr:helix-turn-helix transcriptional regulator [Spirosoma arboris]
MSDKTKRLADVFASLKIPQKEFAFRLETDVSTVNQLLAGTRKIGPNVSNKICQKLGLNPTWWEAGEGEMYLPKKVAEEKPNQANDNEREMAEKLRITQEKLIQTQEQLILTQAELLEERKRQDIENKKKLDRLTNDPPISDKS